MTPAQRETLRLLARCTMMPGGWDKRFVANLAAKPDDYELSPRQAEWVVALGYRYRRQIGRITGAIRPGPPGGSPRLTNRVLAVSAPSAPGF
jgi:hypothetical protein